jgi:hypothetical protein
MGFYHHCSYITSDRRETQSSSAPLCVLGPVALYCIDGNRQTLIRVESVVQEKQKGLWSSRPEVQVIVQVLPTPHCLIRFGINFFMNELTGPCDMYKDLEAPYVRR